jgi:hypothetical protein
MRDLIDSLLQIGLKVEFSVDASGSPTIRVHPISSGCTEKPLFSCTLTPGTFRESAEDALAAFLKSIQKKH